MRRWVAAVGVVVVLGACGGDDGGGSHLGAPDCSDVIGQVLTADEWDKGCYDPATDTVYASGSFTCPDGRELYWNDAGWGYAGEMSHPHRGPDLTPPAEDYDRCART